MKNIRVLLLSLMLLGCAGEKTSLETTNQGKQESLPMVEKKEGNEMITFTATVVFKELEGGFFGLDADNGKKYLPQGMDKSLLKNGMKVRVKGIILTDIITFQQYGDVLKVVESELIDDSQVRGLNEY